METKRCFISLELSRKAINEIRNIQKIIGKKFIFTGKFTEPENLHLTLKFLGEINNKKIKEIKERLKEVKAEEFEVKLGEIGVFSKKFPKIIWIELKGADELQKDIDLILKEMFELENRFMSHITMARIKYIKDKKELVEYLKSLKCKEKFRVNRFFLKESKLFPEGPIYETVSDYSLEK